MLTSDIINSLLGINESYQAPQKMLDKMLNEQKKNDLFDSFLEHETKMDYEWFQSYFEDEHSDRKVKKQDFTPTSVSELLTRLSGPSNTYFESTAGTGGIMIQHWQNIRQTSFPTLADPRSYWYQVEELSDRAIPFLIFNMAIRGMNGVVLHGDSLTRQFKDVYFIRNDTDDFLAYGEVVKMPHTNLLKKELNILGWV